MKPTTDIYCPKCGRKMQQMGANWGCTQGNMPLSVVAFNLIEELVTHPPSTEDPMTHTFDATRWFCPADATRLVEHDGAAQCPVCHRMPPKALLYNLMEKLPHRDEQGRYH